MTETLLPAPTRRRGRPPASDSALTRERILQAAQRAFADSGFEATTFQAIAVDVGVTRPAISNYFSSKADLYSAVVCRVSNTVLDAIHCASEESTLADQVPTFIRAGIRGEHVDPSLPGFLVQSAIDVAHLPPIAARSAAIPTGWPTC